MSLAYILLGADSQVLKDTAVSLLGVADIAWEGDNCSPEQSGVWVWAGDPRPSLEGAAAMFKDNNFELAKVIAVVDAAKLMGAHDLYPWGDMLAHFSDAMLLTNTQNIPAGELKKLTQRWSDRPMLIHRWPQDQKHLADIIYPEARRLSQIFEADAAAALDDWKAGALFIENGVDDDEEEENPNKKKKINTHTKQKKNVNQANLDDIEPIPEEAYFRRDAVGHYSIKAKTP